MERSLSARLVALSMMVVLACSPLSLFAQQPQPNSRSPVIKGDGSEQTWTVNFKETDIEELIRFVSKALSLTVVIDPKVKGRVQVISANPLNREELYQLFLSILEVHGFAAIESGNVLRIVPRKAAKTSPTEFVPNDEELNENSNVIITQTIRLENVSAVKLVPSIRPLSSTQGAHLAAHQSSNVIIISDTEANITRIRKVIESIDRSAVQETDIIPLEHASAEEVVRMLERLQKTQTQKGQADSKKLILVADKRINSVLINGDEMQRARIKALVRQLDTPLVHSGNVKVVYLEYALASDLASVLSKVVQNMQQMGSNKAAVKIVNRNSATIEADEGTNSLIITAEADVMQSLLSVVAQLDIRRAQVLVEAIIVELSAGDDQNIGIEWLFINDHGTYGSSSTVGLAGSTAASAFAVDENGNTVDSRAGLAATLAGIPGQVLGLGRIDEELSFNVIVNALRKNTKANILSTPSIVTMDNEEAFITVGEKVPFVTGSYTSTGDGSSNPGNPFQTVNRENVGITLRVTPQINSGDSLILAIEQEVSSVKGTAALNSNVITSERSIKTKVLANNGEIIVLGGLIEDDVTEETQKVPLLGDIPFFGRLFRSTAVKVGKKHLLIFLKPTILRDSHQMSRATAKKYRYIRNQQLNEINKGVEFFEDETLPLLPQWEKQMELLREMKKENEASASATIDLR